jgi:RHS repeat-associated protein
MLIDCRVGLAPPAPGNYRYRVMARYGALSRGWSATSNPVNYLTSGPCTPAIPSNFRATPAVSTDGNFSLNWNASDCGATRYILEEKLASNADFGFLTEVTSLNLAITSRPTASYQYRIQACQPVGKGGVVCSVFSAPISVQVQITGGLTPPTSMQCRFTITSAVFNCDRSVAGSSLIDSGTDYTVQWTAVSGATRYELCEEGGNSSGSCTSETTLSKTLRKPNSDIGDFTYAVRACNALGCSALFAPSMPVTVRCRPQQNCGNLRAPPVVTYVHTDQLGSPIAETNSSGAVTARFRYEPYGQSLEASVAQGPSYIGHVYDQSSGLIYMQQRYYDPMIGRFLSTDPAAVDGMGFNFNRYAYAANNPYKYVDPDGRNPAILIEACAANPACANTARMAVKSATRTVLNSASSAMSGAVSSAINYGWRSAFEQQGVGLAPITTGGTLSEGTGTDSSNDEGSQQGTATAGNEGTATEQPTETELSPVKERDANGVARDHGYKDAHEAKKNLGDSKANIYKDKETGKYWIWNGKRGSEKSKL